jgi:hypothetical protein
MKQRCIAALICLSILLPHTCSYADPILKPKKYHGPIPKRSFGLNIGFLGGPSNEEMWNYLDGLIDQPFRSDLDTQDFGTSLNLDLLYTAKVHPNFALRVKGSVAFLKSSSTGLMSAALVDTTGNTLVLEFDRSFDIVLSSIEASAMYYFTDASVSEFQSYIGAGFSLYLPYTTYKEDLTDFDTGLPYDSRDKSKMTGEPGVNAVLGALYHLRNDLALSLEGRLYMAQSKYKLEVPTTGAGNQEITFDINYDGFVLVAGVAKFF